VLDGNVKNTAQCKLKLIQGVFPCVAVSIAVCVAVCVLLCVCVCQVVLRVVTATTSWLAVWTALSASWMRHRGSSASAQQHTCLSSTHTRW